MLTLANYWHVKQWKRKKVYSNVSGHWIFPYEVGVTEMKMLQKYRINKVVIPNQFLAIGIKRVIANIELLNITVQFQEMSSIVWS